MIHITIDWCVLLAGALIGFFTGAHRKKGAIRFLPFFMLLSLAVEVTGQLLQKRAASNAALYNFFFTLEICYYIYFFREAVYGEKTKKIIGITLWAFPLVSLIDIFFIQGIHVFQTYTYTLASVLMITMGVVYFYRLFKTPGHIDLLREPAFWMSIGILFFYVCGLSMMSIFNYIGEMPVSVRLTIKKILKLVNAFFYLFFIIAILCRRNATRKS